LTVGPQRPRGQATGRRSLPLIPSALLPLVAEALLT
jgi:hypothetical protein